MTQSSPGRVMDMIRGDGVRARALRATFWSISNVVGMNGMRLLSNIILTRLLFPEAFGLMALVQVFIYALVTFSDIGINTSVLQSKRGDDPDFLDTAWTLQIIRGGILWLGACVLAWPVSRIYGHPDLLTLLPVASLSLVVNGFQPMRAALAGRHLALGRLTVIQLFVQLATLLLTVLLAWWWHSVWALAMSQVIGALLNNLLVRLFMEGHPDRFRWDWTSVHEIVGFGRFIFLSTIATFLITSSDRAILGTYVDVTTFGIYSIAQTFGSLPVLIVTTVSGRVMLPLYRMKSPRESDETRQKIRRAGRMLSAFGVIIAVVLAFCGTWLVDVLYDSRYALAGPMLVLFALNAIPSNVMIGTEAVMLAHGDSRRHFFLTVSLAIVQVVLLFVMIHLFGVVGGIVAPGLALLLTYPIRARMVAHYRAWDPLNDVVGLGVGLLLTGLAFVLHWEEIMKLFP